jgi:hypothetical protein
MTPVSPLHSQTRIVAVTNENQTAHTIFPLSAEVKTLSRGYDNLAGAIIGLLNGSEIIFESAWGRFGHGFSGRRKSGCQDGP